MCGIAGISTTTGLRSGDPQLHDRMLQTLAHRGPDNQHVVGDARSLVGVRRLSIIDVEGGRQPLTDESGLIVAAQNGEIYNFVELRRELEQRGHVFRSQTDTEVIVHLYEDFGVDFVAHLRGMFAIAIWDGRVGRLVLARDRLGKKPLYWRLSDDRLVYASELKAIIEDLAVPRVVSRESLARYLRYQYVPGPQTIFEGVSKLPPATVLTWDGGSPVIERYWNVSYEPKPTRDIRDDVAEGLGILREAVRLRLRSDVPVGVFLSGGMDSSVVTALMAAQAGQRVRTFSIGFDEKEYDELASARAVAAHFETQHTESIVRLDAISLLPDLAYHFDEPFGDSSAIPTFRVSQLAAADVKVVLTGDGGDESFGGYDRYLAYHLVDVLTPIPNAIIRGVARAGGSLAAAGRQQRLRRRLKVVERLIGLPPDERYLALATIIPPSISARLLRTSGRDATEGYLQAAFRFGPEDPLDRLLSVDLHTYLPEDLLVKVDRATMANSLEARAPLLDHRLVEFAAKLPGDRKIDRAVTKVLLRRMAAQLLPAELVNRPKRGFRVPVREWFRGGLGDVFADLALAPNAASNTYLDTAVSRSLLAEHRDGRGDHGATLWVLLMFEVWARRWLSAKVD